MGSSTSSPSLMRKTRGDSACPVATLAMLLRQLARERWFQRPKARRPEIHGTGPTHALQGVDVPQLESGRAGGRDDTVYDAGGGLVPSGHLLWKPAPGCEEAEAAAGEASLDWSGEPKLGVTSPRALSTA